jgi:signal transduction histidine kinase/CheY-like chemotaxis protein
VPDSHVKLSRRSLELALRTYVLGTWSWNVQTGEFAVDDSWCAALGYQPDAFACHARSWRTLCHPDDIAATEDALERHVAGRSDVFVAERRVRTCHDGWVWIRDVGEAVEWDDRGRATRLVGVHVDIDTQKRTDIALRTLARIRPEVDGPDVLTRICEAATTALGVRFACVAVLTESDGEPSASVSAGWLDGRPVEPFEYLLAGTPCELAISETFCCWREDAASRFPKDELLRDFGGEAYAGVRLIDARRQTVGILAIVHDRPLSARADIEPMMQLFASRAGAELEREQYEARLLAACREAELANDAKTAFVASVGHEIRTPMTAIAGYAELLAEPGCAADAIAAHADVIGRSADHLLSVIDDLLDLSKIEAGRMDIERIACDPGWIMRDAMNVVQPRADAKGLELSTRCEGGMLPRVLCDPTRLRQILINLLGNAVKFTNAGSVTVGCAHEPASGRLAFTVRDTGIGMSAEQVEAALRFEAFRQADASMARRFGGTGLGLRISQRLARLLGGGLEIESEPGVGSVFRVTVHAPLDRGGATTGPAAAPTERATGPVPLSGCRVVIVDDGVDNRRLFRAFIESAGACVRVVGDGSSALDLLLSPRRTPGGSEPVDLVLLDLNLPDQDGLTVLRALREGGFGCPVIGLTAHTSNELHAQCVREGFTACVSKPISRVRLIEICAQAVHRRGVAA